METRNQYKNGATPKSQTIREINNNNNNNNNNNMKKLQLTSLLTLLFCGLLSTATYAQFDKMVIGDNNNGQVVISNLNGTNLDTLTQTSVYQSFYDADVDPINQKIYMAWYYGIYSMNYDGSNLDTLVFYPTVYVVKLIWTFA